MVKLWRVSHHPEDDGLVGILFTGLLLLPWAIIGGYYNSKPHIIRETNSGVVFQPSIDFNQGRVRAYDFDKDGQLDKVESASFCYRPTIFAWHDVDRNSPLYSGVQGEYSDFLSFKSSPRTKQKGDR